jgi:hypothetical protein
MVDWIGYGTLFAESNSTDPTKFADVTIETPRGDVVATTAVTGFSTGILEGTPGSVAAYIREYAQYVDPFGGYITVKVPPDAANNVMRIPDCKRVRFRLTVFQARAYAVGLVFRFPRQLQPAQPGPPLLPSKYFKVARRSTGQTVGTHQVKLLARGSSLAIDRALSTSLAEAAEHLGVGRRALKVEPATRREVMPRGSRFPGVF